MNPLRTLAVLLALTLSLQVLPSHAAYGDNEGPYETNAPGAFSMVADLLIARPLLIAATAVGAGVFVITLPFAAMGGGIGDAGRALVVEPGKAAFVRCLGCTGDGYNKRE